MPGHGAVGEVESKGQRGDHAGKEDGTFAIGDGLAEAGGGFQCHPRAVIGQFGDAAALFPKSLCSFTFFRDGSPCPFRARFAQRWHYLRALFHLVYVVPSAATLDENMQLVQGAYRQDPEKL